jgi:putative ABC transport system ATP-binding protein
VIALERISKTYGSGKSPPTVLHPLDLAIGEGEFVAIMGPSGSGKSTLLNILGALDVPSGGCYRFDGSDLGALTPDQRALFRRLILGFVFQGFNLLKRTSALENVEMPLLYQGVPAVERRARAMEALEQVGLAERFHHDPSQLSGGQQQRVAIARAIVTQPQVLIADEPTGNLDTQRGHEIMELIRGFNDKGITVIMVTHEAEIAAYASRTILLRDGRIEKDEANVL